MTINKFNKYVNNIVSKFFMLKFYNIQTREDRVILFTDGKFYLFIGSR